MIIANVKDRIREYTDYKRISIRKFEDACGLTNGYVSSIRKSIGVSKLNGILNAFPDLSREWLLYGEGEMIRPVPEDHVADVVHSVPLVPIAAQGGNLSEFAEAVRRADCEMLISPIKDAELAITIHGDSMSPEYPNGSQVLIRRINEAAFIEWGKTYVLDTCNGAVVKTLAPSEHENCVRCLSINPSPIYAPFDVPWSEIYGVYRVLLCMSRK